MPDISLGSARIVTMRELANDTSRIMRELNDTSEPALVTKHGRFIALIQPLAGVKVEAIAVQNLLSTMPTAAEVDDEADESVDSTDAMRRLGLNIRLSGDG
ncbi:hypothetical protein ACFWZT_31025 [Streptomyces alboflavus]|uniref:hypothetical protein n=1 Tax=Streptomyces alboflavus TaxID=67267 RepID=UPI00368A6E2F